MKMSKTLIFFCCIFIPLTILTACSSATTEFIPPKAEAGALNLQNWDVMQDAPVPLEGEWAMYWQQLLTPDEVIADTAVSTIASCLEESS